MKRILFVDDEQNILDGLKRMLRPYSKDWEMLFVSNGQSALAEFEKLPFDVLVTDMRMPQMDGMELLKRIKTLYPQTVRIVLSGFSEYETALRAVPVANQFLIKPCDPDVLKAVIERSCNLQQLLGNKALAKIVGEMDNLPSLPRIYQALTKALMDSRIGLSDIAKIVKQDIGISTKILQLVNSAFFSLRRRVTSIEAAVSFLGTNTLKNLALSCEVFDSFKGDKQISIEALEAQQEHAMLSAKIAKNLVADPLQSDDAYTVAMLHDVGKLVIASRLPEKFNEITRKSHHNAISRHIIEEEVLGVTHSEIGAYLLGLWGLPYPMVEAVAFHHNPVMVGTKKYDLLSAIHISNALANHVRYGTQVTDMRFKSGSSIDRSDPILKMNIDGLDYKYLAKLNILPQLNQWLHMAYESLIFSQDDE